MMHEICMTGSFMILYRSAFIFGQGILDTLYLPVPYISNGPHGFEAFYVIMYRVLIKYCVFFKHSCQHSAAIGCTEKY